MAAAAATNLAPPRATRYQRRGLIGEARAGAQRRPRPSPTDIREPARGGAPAGRTCDRLLRTLNRARSDVRVGFEQRFLKSLVPPSSGWILTVPAVWQP
jgi:hypothetical protein